MKNDSGTMAADMLPHLDIHLSNVQAEQITLDECEPDLTAFIAAALMECSVSTAKAALLLEHISKDAMSGDAEGIGDQMLLDNWEADLSDGETIAAVSERLYQFLATERGIRLYNFCVKIFARTSTSMYD